MSLKNKRISILILGLIVITGLMLTLYHFRDSSMRPPYNVILIIMDAMRADHLSCNGYQTPHYPNITPNIDALSYEGINFKNAFSHVSLTLPSMTTMFTSLYPSVHGIQTNESRLPDVFVTMTEIFKRNNYKTAGFVSGGYVKSEFNLNQGFDTYIDKYDSIKNISQKAYNWLEENGSEKFFMYIHCKETHVPYNPPDEYKIPGNYTWDHIWVGSSQFASKYDKKDMIDIYNQEGFLEKVISLYDGGIKYADTELGKFINELKAINLYDNTLIIFTSDHGEEFRDHGGFSHSKLYEETTRVPLIMKLPGKYRKLSNRGIDRLVGHIDLLPTINDITNMAFNDYSLQGQSLLPLIKGKKLKDRIIFMERKNLFGLRSINYKFLTRLQTEESPELYDLNKDPKEKSNLLSNPKKEILLIKKEMEAKLRRMMKENEYIALKFKMEKIKTYSSEDIKKFKELEEDLKSLGYIK